MRLVLLLPPALGLSLAACDQILPNRSPEVPAPPPAVEQPAPPARARPARRAPPPAPDPAGVDETQVFNQIRRGLRRLVAAEQGFYAENGAYTEDMERLGYKAEGGTAIRFLSLKRNEWAASGTHPSLPGRDCVIYVGPVSPAPTSAKYGRSAQEGIPACDVGPPPRGTSPAASATPAPAADTTSELDAVRPAVQMRVDLRNMVIAQNAYLATQGLYSRRVEPLALQYMWRPGVTIVMLSADDVSWAASATHSGWPGKSCVIWYGPVRHRPATQAQGKRGEESGVPVCDD